MVTATVDWCEPNYVISPYCAEFANTVSSLVISLAGAVGYVLYGQNVKTMRLFALLATVGFGSCLFHSTLDRRLQMLDEIPMILLVVEMTVLCVRKMFLAPIRGLGLIYALAIGYLTLMHSPTSGKISLQFLIFQACFVIWSLTLGLLLLQKSNALNQTKLFVVSAAVFLSGWMCWILDNALCASFGNLYLHAVWHILSSIGVFGLITIAGSTNVKGNEDNKDTYSLNHIKIA